MTPRSLKTVGFLVSDLLILFVVIVVGSITYQHFVPHLLFNGTTGHLYQYRQITRSDGDVDLRPGLFQGGERKDQVETVPLGAGLEAWNSRFLQAPLGAVSVQGFRLEAGAQGIACGSELLLTIGYDADDLLQSATVQQGGACL